jgi:hypothetical protein
MVGSAQARNQIKWIPSPGLDLTDFAFFDRNLFYSTSVRPCSSILAAWPGWG